MRITFCPGPGAIIPEWKISQVEVFGRNDKYYEKVKSKTLNWIKKISEQDEVVPVSGASSTAAILSFNSFLSGSVCVVNTGYYSDRWFNYLKEKIYLKNNIKKLKYLTLYELEKSKEKFNWIIFVYVETSICKKYSIVDVKKLCKRNKSKLLVDATGSIGLEKNHKLADVVFFSSCKGLFGPTGLSFVAHKNNIKKFKNGELWFDYDFHKESKYTLGYNCMLSLEKISKSHSKYKSRVLFARNYMRKYVFDDASRPKIGVALKKKINKSKVKEGILLYSPRDKNIKYDTIFLTGLIKFKKKEIKKYLNKFIISNLNDYPWGEIN